MAFFLPFTRLFPGISKQCHINIREGQLRNLQRPLQKENVEPFIHKTGKNTIKGTEM